MNDTEKNLLALISIDERIFDLQDEINLYIVTYAFSQGKDVDKYKRYIEKNRKKLEQLKRARGGIKIRLSKTGVKRPPKVSWIKNGRCINEKKQNICNLGYACDGCPWNKDKVKKK